MQTRLIDVEKILKKSYYAYPNIDHYCVARQVVDISDVLEPPTLPTYKCENCHHEVGEEDNFCSYCGRKLYF